MVFQYINVCQVPREIGLGFQHLPRDLANVNAWNSMFDPYINAQGANALYNRERYLQPKSSKSATVIISNCNNQYKGELLFR